MAVEPSRYIAREMVMSSVINAGFSVVFFLLAFGSVDPIPVWGIGNYAFDFIPQSFAIGFMATFVPSLMCRKAIATGRVARSCSTSPPVTGVVRAFVIGIVAIVLGAGLCAVALWAIGIEILAYITAFVAKVAYGAALGALVTRFALARMLA